MTDIRVFVENLIRWEGLIAWLYRDVLGYCTTAIGNLIEAAADAAALPFMLVSQERPATKGEIVAEFQRVMSMPKGLPAANYRGDLALPEDAVMALAVVHLHNDYIPGLLRLLPTFASLPSPAQEALVDLDYNLGNGGLGKFHELLAAVKRADWPEAAAQSHVVTSRPDRNAWRFAQFIAAGTASA